MIHLSSSFDVADNFSFHGAAPLHHTLLEGCTETGVTLQTLHPHKMDHGQILAQTPFPGFSIPHSDKITVPEFTELVAPIGGEMLVQGLRDALFVPPIVDLASSPDHSRSMLRYAHKIMSKDRHVNWKEWTTGKILRRSRIVGPLWNCIVFSPTQKRRVIWSSSFSETSQRFDLLPGEAALSSSLDDNHLYVRATDGKTLKVEYVTLEGLTKRTARQSFVQANLVDTNARDEPVNCRPIRKLRYTFE